MIYLSEIAIMEETREGVMEEAENIYEFIMETVWKTRGLACEIEYLTTENHKKQALMDELNQQIDLLDPALNELRELDVLYRSITTQILQAGNTIEEDISGRFKGMIREIEYAKVDALEALIEFDSSD